ncbi:hypothetical protein BH24ACT15_BH24ACT15_20570 [soil metagenome]
MRIIAAIFAGVASNGNLSQLKHDLNQGVVAVIEPNRVHVRTLPIGSGSSRIQTE